MGLAIGIAATAWLWVSRPARRSALLPWLLPGAFAPLAAVMAAVGRWRFGIDHALTSRSQTFSALFWITVLVLAAMAVRELATCSARRRTVILGVAGAAACLAAVAYGDTWTASAERLRTRVEALRRGRECVIFHAVAPRDCLALIYPDPETARRRAARLEALALGPFRPRARPPALATYSVVAERPVGSVDAVQLGPALLVNPVSAAYRATEVIVSGRAAHEVLVVVDGQVAGRTRPDSGGWLFRFGAFRLVPGPHSIEGYALLGDGRIARLARRWSITVAPPPSPPRN
jgi:hypothetical protein